MADLGRLEGLLTGAAKILHLAAEEIRDLEFEKSRNIRSVGEALATIFDLMNRIYAERPDLRPKHLEKDET